MLFCMMVVSGLHVGALRKGVTARKVRCLPAMVVAGTGDAG
jgi:hypothetical protein